MLAHLFLGMSLLGAEWVLYFLIFLSILSFTLIIERIRFYHAATRGLDEFRKSIRHLIAAGKWDEALKATEERKNKNNGENVNDLETEMVSSLISQRSSTFTLNSLAPLAADDAVLRAKLLWERGLSYLATIGSNAPFVGLFGTVLGIIQAFHHLSQQAGGTGAQGVTAGIAEALVATAVGLLVAIPAVVAFNLFQRKVKTSITQAEAMKNFLTGMLAREQGDHGTKGTKDGKQFTVG